MGLIEIKTGKNGADVTNLSQRITETYEVLDAAVSNNSDRDEAVITSGRDGDHLEDSKHYSGEAVDIRGNNVTDEQLRAIADEIREKLGPLYDVGAEFFEEAPNKDHVHIEYDPPMPKPKPLDLDPPLPNPKPPVSPGQPTPSNSAETGSVPGGPLGGMLGDSWGGGILGGIWCLF